MISTITRATPFLDNVQAYSVDFFVEYPEVKKLLAQQDQHSSDEGMCKALAAGRCSSAFTVRKREHCLTLSLRKSACDSVLGANRLVVHMQLTLRQLATGVQLGDELARMLRPMVE